ncbi:hypothetical protein [Pendulispora albinea]|uniref:Secreted protein n=1 Tax=Pendulispora albinea TaxID=2741071 RepID=A0ABZ2M1N3_9BACT
MNMPIGHRGGRARWTVMLLATSVVCGIAGSIVSTAPLSLPLLVISVACAAAALVVHWIETRRPRLVRRRYP